MNHLLSTRRAIVVSAILMALTLTPLLAAQADAPATQPTTQPAVADSPEVKELRHQLLAWDAGLIKMSLVDFRKTFHTENEREAVYTDFLAHDTWETGITEQAVRDKWGVDADTQFCRLVGFTSREEDQACQIKIDGDRATASWNIKEMKPEKLIKVDGHWQCDIHSMWDDWIAENPTMETEKRPLGKVMKQIRADITDGKYDDADSFMPDLKTKMQNPDGN